MFLGSASGIADGNPATAAAQLESNQADAHARRERGGRGRRERRRLRRRDRGRARYDAGQTDEGAAFVFPGSASGIADGNPATAAAQLESNQASAQLGSSVAGAGDVNGDGYADVIVGARLYDAGADATRARRSCSSASASGSRDGSPATAAAQLESNQADAQFGCSVAGAGDVNGDGYADVIVGAVALRRRPDRRGRGVRVPRRARRGSRTAIPRRAAAQLESDQADARLGTSVAGAGDVNGDGYADVIVGAHHYDAGQTDEGAAFVFLGSASGIADGNPATAAAQLESNQAELAVRLQRGGGGRRERRRLRRRDRGRLPATTRVRTDEGAAFVFLGSASGIADGNPATAAAQLESNQSGAVLGYSVAGPAT